jgi:hypothetical protein
MMTEKYFRLYDRIYRFHPDTHDVLRIDGQRCERLDHPAAMRMLRLKAVEITRRQAEEALADLGSFACRAS